MHQRFAVLALGRAAHPAAQHMRHKLRTVADAQHRHAQAEQFFAYRGRIGQIHAVGPAREDNAPRLLFPNGLKGLFVRDYLGIHMALAHTARDKLVILAAEINDKHHFVHTFLPPGSPAKPRGVGRGAPCGANFHSYTV